MVPCGETKTSETKTFVMLKYGSVKNGSCPSSAKGFFDLHDHTHQQQATTSSPSSLRSHLGDWRSFHKRLPPRPHSALTPFYLDGPTEANERISHTVSRRCHFFPSTHHIVGDALKFEMIPLPSRAVG